MITHKQKLNEIIDYCNSHRMIAHDDNLQFRKKCESIGCPLGKDCSIRLFPDNCLKMADIFFFQKDIGALSEKEIDKLYIKLKGEENMREYICEDSEKEEISTTDKSGGVAHQDKDSEKRNTLYETICELVPNKDEITVSSKINDNVMAVAHAMLTLHNICKENKEKGTPCEQCVLSNRDGCCGIVGKFPGEWKFTLEVLK